MQQQRLRDLVAGPLFPEHDGNGNTNFPSRDPDDNGKGNGGDGDGTEKGMQLGL